MSALNSSVQGRAPVAAGSGAAQGRRILRLPDVLRIYPVSRSHWYAGVKSGRLPQPVSLGKRAVGWWEHEVLAAAGDAGDN